MSWIVEYTRSLSRTELITAAGCGMGAHGYLAFGQDSSNGNPLVTTVLFALLAVPAWYLFARLRQVLFLPWREYWVWGTWGAAMWRYVLRAAVFLAEVFACVLASPVAIVVCLVLMLLPTRLLADASDEV